MKTTQSIMKGGIIVMVLVSMIEAHDLGLYPVLMPKVVPSTSEVYLCTMIDMSELTRPFG